MVVPVSPGAGGAWFLEAHTLQTPFRHRSLTWDGDLNNI